MLCALVQGRPAICSLPLIASNPSTDVLGAIHLVCLTPYAVLIALGPVPIHGSCMNCCTLPSSLRKASVAFALPLSPALHGDMA